MVTIEDEEGQLQWEEQKRRNAAIELSIWRKTSNARQRWRECGLPQCRRGRRCMASAVPVPCQRLFPPPSQMSDEEIALSRADLKQALSKRLAELQEEKVQKARMAKDEAVRLHRRDARS
jgi:hypothetical protein